MPVRADNAEAGDRARVERVILANRHLTVPTNRRAAERSGLDLLEAFAAFADGRRKAPPGSYHSACMFTSIRARR